MLQQANPQFILVTTTWVKQCTESAQSTGEEQVSSGNKKRLNMEASARPQEA